MPSVFTFQLMRPWQSQDFSLPLFFPRSCVWAALIVATDTPSAHLYQFVTLLLQHRMVRHTQNLYASTTATAAAATLAGVVVMVVAALLGVHQSTVCVGRGSWAGSWLESFSRGHQVLAMRQCPQQVGYQLLILLVKGCIHLYWQPSSHQASSTWDETAVTCNSSWQMVMHDLCSMVAWCVNA